MEKEIKKDVKKEDKSTEQLVSKKPRLRYQVDHNGVVHNVKWVY